MHSIRINSQWRIVFRWMANGPIDCSIRDYEFILEEYLQPTGIPQNAMARSIGVSPRTINEIVHGKRSITPDMSIRFGAFFRQSDNFWHGLQVEFDSRALAKKVFDCKRPATLDKLGEHFKKAWIPFLSVVSIHG